MSLGKFLSANTKVMLCHPPDVRKKVPLWARTPFRQGQAGFCPQTVWLALFLSGMLKTFQRQQTLKLTGCLKKPTNEPQKTTHKTPTPPPHPPQITGRRNEVERRIHCPKTIEKVREPGEKSPESPLLRERTISFFLCMHIIKITLLLLVWAESLLYAV